MTLARRNFLQRALAAAGTLFALPLAGVSHKLYMEENKTKHPLQRLRPLGFQWETADPFLFCVHHEDFFPRGRADMSPDAPLDGRHIGQDFIVKDGWRMYHGERIPGFPGHPHRGFETITVVRKGYVDHADSMGAAGRYGHGDVQWMTAGAGLQHSEMFPMLRTDRENPVELFQIWLNLPRKDKWATPHFKMLWNEDIPRFVHGETGVPQTQVEIIGGSWAGFTAPAPPPQSWAADPKNHVAIWNIIMQPGAQWQLPVAVPDISRSLFVYKGTRLRISGREIPEYHAADLLPEAAATLQNGDTEARILLLQGRPIAEPVVQHGPFVMNTREEITQAFADYQRTRFGGWPWPEYGQVHERSKGRFARHADGREETRG